MATLMVITMVIMAMIMIVLMMTTTIAGMTGIEQGEVVAVYPGDLHRGLVRCNLCLFRPICTPELF